jgi:Tol biopolymer transport system component
MMTRLCGVFEVFGGITRSKATRHLPALAALLVAASACGSDEVDVGDLSQPAPSAGAAGEGGVLSSSDTGIAIKLADGTRSDEQCSIEALSQHRLVFDSDAGRLERRVYSMRADGTELQVLTPDDVLAQDAAFSPDGTTLAYGRPEGIEYLDLATGQTTLAKSSAEQPSWSPDGSSLAYMSAGGVTLSPTSDLELAATYICHGCYFPTFSADSSSLIYAQQADEGSSPRYGIGRLNPTTLEVREVVQFSTVRVTRPTASPDALWIAAAAECGGNPLVYSIWVSPYALSTTACEGRPVTTINGTNATNPVWGPDSLVAFELGSVPRDIAIVDVETGEACVIPRLGDDRNPSWVPDTAAPPR